MPLSPSNDPDIALAQEWLGELDTWFSTHGTAGPDPFDIKQHPWLRAVQDKPLLRKASTVLCDRFPHAARRALTISPSENAKTHALIAIGKLRLNQLTGDTTYLEGAEGHLRWLREHPAESAHGLAWGYPFAVSGQGLETPANRPVCVVSAIAGEAFLLAYTITGDAAHLEAATAIARHFMDDIPRLGDTGDAHCFAYGPADGRAVHNANLLVAQHLLELAVHTNDETMARAALRAVQFTLNGQRTDGAFPYGVALPGQPYESDLLALVDHHHTGFVLRSLHAINLHAESDAIKQALRQGYAFYKTLCTEDGMPRDAHRNFPVDIHACAEAVLCPAALKSITMGANRQSTAAMRWAWSTMRDRKTGAPHYRKYRGFTSKIAYPRWGVAWMYRALAEYLCAFQKGG